MNDYSNYKENLENINEGIYFVDNERKITFWNKGAERISGFSAKEVLGKYCMDNILNHIDDKGNKLCSNGCPLHKTIIEGSRKSRLIYLHHKEGHRVSVNVSTTPLYLEGKIIGATEVFTDNINNEISIKEIDKLKAVAMFDNLTSLKNKKYLETAMKTKISEYKHFNTSFGVVLLNIDNFRVLNENVEQCISDQVLQMVSNSIKASTRGNDLVGRWSGDEFIVILPSINNINTLKDLAERMRIIVKNSSLRNKENNMGVTCSIGATLIKEKDTIEDITKRVVTLMTQSKLNGKNKVTIG
ncbi:sensor domain-containing diguanylate cyclase [Clostridium grantii]|uniref:PAS domain S-box-containing protein/diguanylate cyclase (GGDEF) domain-containing protein n=1 Tax=Clostridium grantii DSM 8605 TaxID=1121316 RepID=A0A1M5XB64_9CLOT|nr:sensor domain-containing diguanylate cyclase [Clostridium grantii]SHH96744.1 PAS domain S-box-containing protein/diguanylate cyclase (GGDEF) domain-containing protein [Clostridium grantii DSM 8605]